MNMISNLPDILLKLCLPSDRQILRTALRSFPRNPLITDINKEKREGFITGQVFFRKEVELRVKEIVGERPPRSEFVSEPVEPVQMKTETNQDPPEFKKHFKEHVNLIFLDKKLKPKTKLELLYSIQNLTIDEELFRYVVLKIELLDDGIRMRKHMQTDRLRKVRDTIELKSNQLI